MKDKMMFYGVTLGKRYTRGQKELFLEEAVKACGEHGRRTCFQTRQNRLSGLCSLVIGDLDQADTVVACAYDTPGASVLPGIRYYPFHPARNTREEGRVLLFHLFLAAACFLPVFLLLKDFTALSMGGRLWRGLAALPFLAVAWRLLQGFANPVNFNRNSAAVAVVMKLAETVDNPQVAFVLMDRGCSSLWGARVLQEACKEEKTVILLDGLAAGEKMVTAHRKGADISGLWREGWIDKEYEETQNILGLFSKGILLTSGSVEKGQFVVRHTRSRGDREVDMERLTEIYEMMKKRLDRAGREI